MLTSSCSEPRKNGFGCCVGCRKSTASVEPALLRPTRPAAVESIGELTMFVKPTGAVSANAAAPCVRMVVDAAVPEAACQVSTVSNPSTSCDVSALTIPTTSSSLCPHATPLAIAAASANLAQLRVIVRPRA